MKVPSDYAIRNSINSRYHTQLRRRLVARATPIEPVELNMPVVGS
jgi:hypothetical protein